MSGFLVETARRERAARAHFAPFSYALGTVFMLPVQASVALRIYLGARRHDPFVARHARFAVVWHGLLWSTPVAVFLADVAMAMLASRRQPTNADASELRRLDALLGVGTLYGTWLVLAFLNLGLAFWMAHRARAGESEPLPISRLVRRRPSA